MLVKVCLSRGCPDCQGLRSRGIAGRDMADNHFLCGSQLMIINGACAQQRQ